ncbi:MAG TPA: hypothetical protein VGQ03_08515 [Nitrososphaera sp.]|nr:hypothetical protein [Nitrososphaera sp.]
MTIEQKCSSYDNGNSTDAMNKDRPTPFEMKRMAYGGFSTIVDFEV